MKLIILTIALLAVNNAIISCDQNKSLEQSYNDNRIRAKLFESFLKKTTGSSIPQKQIYLIIPVNQGCHSCIEKAIQFAGANIRASKFGVVLTSSKMKEINSLLASSLNGLSKTLFICDGKGQAGMLGVSAFPKIIYCNSIDNVHSIDLNSENIDTELNALVNNIN